MPTDEPSSANSYVYSANIIETAATSMADAFVQRVQRFRPEDRVALVRRVRERIEANAPAIAAELAGKINSEL